IQRLGTGVCVGRDRLVVRGVDRSAGPPLVATRGGGAQAAGDPLIRGEQAPDEGRPTTASIRSGRSYRRMGHWAGAGRFAGLTTGPGKSSSLGPGTGNGLLLVRLHSGPCEQGQCYAHSRNAHESEPHRRHSSEKFDAIFQPSPASGSVAVAVKPVSAA